MYTQVLNDATTKMDACCFIRSDKVGPGDPAAHKTNRLPLLPSGPGGVHRVLLHRAQPRNTSHACWSSSDVSVAERVGFEPTVPLPGRMLSKHVDSSTLAPLRINRQGVAILARRILEHQGNRPLGMRKHYFRARGRSVISQRGIIDGAANSFCSSISFTNRVAA